MDNTQNANMQVTRENEVFKQRLDSAERRLRWVTLALIVAILLPFLAGAYKVDEKLIMLKDDKGNDRIELNADGPQGAATVEIRDSKGKVRVVLGVLGDGSPKLLVLDSDGSIIKSIP